MGFKFLLPIGLAIGVLAIEPAWAADRWAGLEPCELSAAGGRLSVQARCGQFDVPENPDQPEGRQIELAYAVLPARSRAKPDPVFFLAGGPGQSAREAAALMRHALREVNRERDLIFLDQRGAGASNPLDCDFDQVSDWLEMDFEAIGRVLRECHDQQWDADVRFYTSTDAARDLDDLRARYGFERINLIGGSYGTRLAQVYLRNYPERVRSVVLDGVVPTRLRLGSEHALMLDEALDKLFDACLEDETCRETFPGLHTAFGRLVDHYRDNSQAIVIVDPRSGDKLDLDFDLDLLASGLRFLAYSPQTQMMIPKLIHEAATSGDPSRLASQALIVTEQIDESISVGLNFSVGCSEDWPSWPRDLEAGHTLMGNTMLEFYDQVCAWWPAGDAPEDFHQPFDPGTPVLILSGENDPVTPAHYGDEAAEQYANSLHLVGRGLGHITLGQPCFNRLVARFVSSADFGDLDTECLDHLDRAPFFVNLLGPAP
jgi:pimeloyl-ACP methyl ester carboxylesterase